MRFVLLACSWIEWINEFNKNRNNWIKKLRTEIYFSIICVSAGFRRSFRLWRRTSYRRRRQSCTSCSPNSNALATPYEEVALYQRPPQENHRLIILSGERFKLPPETKCVAVCIHHSVSLKSVQKHCLSLEPQIKGSGRQEKVHYRLH